MMEAIRTSETPVYFNKTTRRYIPEGCHLCMYSGTADGPVETKVTTSRTLSIVVTLTKLTNRVMTTQKEDCRSER
jgi:hypothetical protein